MRTFTAREIVRAAPEAIFDFVADHRNVPLVLEGVSRWEPVGRRTSGGGARFEVEMKTLGFPLAEVLVLDLWDRPRAIGWRSESGFIPQRGGWRLVPREAGTEIELSISYQPPGAGLGNLVAGAVEGIVRHRLEAALTSIKERLEEPS
ncbi:MAG: SRPBCC family protein [Candidatus Dormibacteraceae bacterium]